MRIISGLHKGRQIHAPKNLPVRPTTDRAKEALFNILRNRYFLPDLQVLDLFSGTGNIAYEFASRGAEAITCVDQDARCIKFITDTAQALDLDIVAIKANVFGYLERSRAPMDLIFADPPYLLDQSDFERIPELVFANALLLEEGTLIVEHAKQMDLSHVPFFTEKRHYGGTAFSFFEREEA